MAVRLSKHGQAKKGKQKAEFKASFLWKHMQTLVPNQYKPYAWRQLSLPREQEIEASKKNWAKQFA